VAAGSAAKGQNASEKGKGLLYFEEDIIGENVDHHHLVYDMLDQSAVVVDTDSKEIPTLRSSFTKAFFKTYGMLKTTHRGHDTFREAITVTQIPNCGDARGHT
jgi:hypothetical protein